MTTNILFYLFYIFQSIFQCLPVEHYWMRVNPLHKGSCHDPSFVANSTYAQSALSIVTDFTYAGLPILIVRQLQMSRYKRISLSLMLGLGAVASVAVIVRIPYVVSLATTHDFLWQTTDVAIWSCVEPGLGLTILNLVVTRPLFRSIFARFGDVTSAAISRNRGYSSKVSGYGKQSYGASTTMASTNGNTMCSDPSCKCHCHQPCTCGRKPTFYEDVTPPDLEQGYALGTVTSPKAAHLNADQKGVRVTTEISATSIHKSDMLRPGARAAREARMPPSSDGYSEHGDKEFLVQSASNGRQSPRQNVPGRAI
jgi:hypothetical protein